MALVRPTVLVKRVDDPDARPPLVGLCAGYELGAWRYDALLDDLLDHLPDFALRYRELQNVAPTDMRRLMRRAFASVYDTTNTSKRGELGELMLHVILRQHCNTIPAVTKIYFKDAANDTVKGFDAVHVVEHGQELELWLGESKFYSDIGQAIKAVVPDLNKYYDANYLKKEFVAISNKVDDSWPQAEQFKRMIDPAVSLDEIFARMCIPVLLTYNSAAVSANNTICAAFEEAFAAEVRAGHATFAACDLPPLSIRLFLVPLFNKDELRRRFDERLAAGRSQ